MGTHRRILWMILGVGACFLLSFAVASLFWFSPFTRARSSGNAARAAHPSSAPRVRVFFAAGLACEGREKDIPLAAWQITCLSKIPINATTPPSVDIPVGANGTGPSAFSIQVPGWEAKVITQFSPAENGGYFLRDPVILRRDTASFSLEMPAVGTDYDVAQVEWLRSLPGEPLALPMGKEVFVPLDFAGAKRLPPLPTGIYRCVLKGRSDVRARDFNLVSELALAPLQSSPRHRTLPLPPALPHFYIGFAGLASDPQQGGGSATGLFCGINIHLRKNTGDLLLASRPLQNAQVVRYGDLRPRPDTVWPVSNLFLEDPVTLAFDCPLSHLDHRMLLSGADGRFTILPQMILPEDERQQKDLFTRMRTLLQVQARNAAARPDFYDSRYLRIPSQQLPNYENFASFANFTRHLSRMSQAAARPIELGAQLSIQKSGANGWKTQVDRMPDRDPVP